MNSKEKEIIERFTENLNQKAKINELTIIGREKEIKEVIYTLSRLFKNNPLLIGYPGVGKTAIVEGLVQKIKQKQVPYYLQNRTIYQLDMMSLRAGAKFQGELEARLKVIFNYMAQPENNAILFIDEIHMIMGDAGGQVALIANLLKPMLSRGEIQCIGATTLEEYRQHIEKDGALVRRFNNIQVSEPNIKETLKILRGIKNNLEIHYELKILDETLSAAVNFSQRYLTSAYLPDKAIDLLDETSSRVKSEMWYEPEIIDKSRQKLEELAIQKYLLEKDNNHQLEKFSLEQEITQQEKKLQTLIDKDRKEIEIIQELSKVKKDLAQSEKELANCQRKLSNYERAGELKYKIIPFLQEKLKNLEKESNHNEYRKYFVTKEDVALTISRKYGLDNQRILVSEQQKLLFLPAILQQRIKGQDGAIRAIAEAIFRARAGIQDPRRPLASFLFLGPTGVGKTEVALTIAEQLFDEKKNLLRFDMTEFSEPHSVSKLLGSPPGYIGFEQTSYFEKVREKPNSVLLFDEIEKCHPQVIDIFLQILDNGFLTLANGREVNFRNTIIVLTSNLASELYFKGTPQKELEEELEFMVRKYFRPEFLNRLDEIVFFNSLGESAIREIVRRELELFVQRVGQTKEIKLKYNGSIVEKILHEAYLPEYGARPIKHYIEKKLGTLVARGIIAQFLYRNGNYLLELESETKEIKITKLSLLESQKSNQNLLKEK